MKSRIDSRPPPVKERRPAADRSPKTPEKVAVGTLLGLSPAANVQSALLRLKPQGGPLSQQSLNSASRWFAYCDALNWAKGLLDESSYVAFLRAGSLNIRSDVAFQEVARRIQSAGDCPKAHELERQLRRAYGFVRTSNRTGFTRKFGLLCSRPSKPIFRPEKLTQIAGRLPEIVDKEYLALRSKFTPWNRSPAGVLHKLYQPGERIVVFDVFESQGCAVWQHPGLVGNLSTLDYLQFGRFGVWYLCNPIDGQYHWNPREQKKSRRSDHQLALRRCGDRSSGSATVP